MKGTDGLRSFAAADDFGDGFGDHWKRADGLRYKGCPPLHLFCLPAG
jgi:hypothetical protein